LIAAGCLFATGVNARADEPKASKKATKGATLLTKNDELTDQDEKDTFREGMFDLTGSPRKVYKVKLTEGKAYQIDLKSKDFNAVLRLVDAGGKQVPFNADYSLDSLQSRIVYP